jgi:hypothetical protein
MHFIHFIHATQERLGPYDGKMFKFYCAHRERLATNHRHIIAFRSP